MLHVPHSLAALLLASFVCRGAVAQEAPQSADLGECLFSGNRETAVRACQAVITANRETPANLAHAYVGRGGARLMVVLESKTYLERNIDRAIADFTEAIRLDPSSPVPYSVRAQAWREKENLDRAIADYSEAIRLAQHAMDVAGYHERRGAVLIEAGQFERAIADFNAAIADDKAWYNRSQAILLRGIAYRGLRDFDRALADFGDVIDHGWQRPLAHAHRGWVHLLSGDLRRAGDDFSAALGRMEQRSAFALALYGRGLARSRSGDEPGGRADILAAAAVDDKLVLQLDLAAVDLLRGGAEKARADFDGALRFNQERTALAWVLYGRGLSRIREGDAVGGSNDLAAARIVDAAAVNDIVRQGLN